jgi:hypothetical protein
MMEVLVLIKPDGFPLRYDIQDSLVKAGCTIKTNIVGQYSVKHWATHDQAAVGMADRDTEALWVICPEIPIAEKLFGTLADKIVYISTPETVERDLDLWFDRKARAQGRRVKQCGSNSAGVYPKCG